MIDFLSLCLVWTKGIKKGPPPLFSQYSVRRRQDENMVGVGG